MEAGLSTKNAPSTAVVIPHYLASAIFLLIGSILMFLSAKDLSSTYFGPHILSLTHIMVLGFITTVIFGALYQLIPVVMEVKLYSETLAHISFYTLIIGVSILSFTFYNSYLSAKILQSIGGTFVLISIITFLVNFLKSAQKSNVKTVQNRFILTSGFWLLMTVSLGMMLVTSPFKNLLGKTNLEWMQIHVQIGVVGWFLMLVIGVASTLMPMFFISHRLNKKYLEYSYYLTNGGLLLMAIFLFANAGFWFLTFATIILISGIGFFFKYNYDSYKKRLRKKLDIGMKLSVLAFTLLFITLVAGILSLVGSQITIVDASKFKLIYGISLVLGFFTALILGQMYKTLPFIVWLKIYKDKVGKFKTKMPVDLYSNKVANYHYYSFVIGFIFLIVGIVFSQELIIKVAAIFYIVTSVLYLINTIKIITHKIHLKPLK